ncbi:BolA/IbaG family iron-sulfur metabolism protein [Alteromonas pelagimontana]|uniref:DNA-binding transcriptional regulator BolA n=1 Tax=Alteromonas pelagimontana TaxID=1858656 RepID=A0A6M4MB14_9ALTE|nr:BolA/IbaG family iron-sulfur metabolism protein [Alteromonas pelagimontana]QJR80362.1 BolA/IbaG family iron-sulfur metabolism protein [Alteromonas pelagimontana]
MQVKAFIEQQLNDNLSPDFLEVQDESHMHNVPPGAQSHFKVTIVSNDFASDRLIGRHRKVNALLAEALAGPVHALALHTFTPAEWEKRGGGVAASPNCLGGSKSAP